MVTAPTANQSSSQRTYSIPLSSSPQKSIFPRFGGQNSCPGCQKAVSLMERGVVAGPQGTRWHSSCLVCGGKKEITTAYLLGRSRDEKKDVPGCGKRLDSAAKTDGEGGVWCRECLVSVSSLVKLGHGLTNSQVATWMRWISPYIPNSIRIVEFIYNYPCKDNTSTHGYYNNRSSIYRCWEWYRHDCKTTYWRGTDSDT